MVNEEPHFIEDQDRVDRMIRGMTNQELLRFGRLGLTDAAAENLFEQKLMNQCGMCQEEVIPGSESTIIVPCCGNRPHKECFIKWAEHSGKCMYCRHKSDPGLRGFDTYVSYFSWIEWSNKMHLLLLADDPSRVKRAIVPLIKALNSKHADTVKEYAAMQLFDLVAREDGQVYVKNMVKEHVPLSLLNILSGGCGPEVKEAAALVFLALRKRGKSSPLMSNPSVASAVSKIDYSRFRNLFAMTVSGREEERESHRDDERVKRKALESHGLHLEYSDILTMLLAAHRPPSPRPSLGLPSRAAGNPFDNLISALNASELQSERDLVPIFTAMLRDRLS